MGRSSAGQTIDNGSVARHTGDVNSKAPDASPRSLDAEVADLRRQLSELTVQLAVLGQRTSPPHKPRAVKVPAIPEEERTPLVVALLEIIELQREEIQALRDEIAQLKGEKPKPTIKPSKLEGNRNPRGSKKPRLRGRCLVKRSFTAQLAIHETVVCGPAEKPEGSRFKGCQYFTVRDIEIKPHNTRYRLERWQTPEGGYVIGKLPPGVLPGHFGPTLVSFILYQYYHALVTQPLLLEQLVEFGIVISEGQLNRLIIENKERYHAEKDEILRVGLKVSKHINVDDTGARHQGKNGYCTHIGNDLFAWFQSTSSKSRINFLELLRAGRVDYILSDLKKTCRKLGISFWSYIKARVSGSNSVPPLPQLIAQRAQRTSP